jgi:hypothetical protein
MAIKNKITLSHVAVKGNILNITKASSPLVAIITPTRAPKLIIR